MEDFGEDNFGDDTCGELWVHHYQAYFASDDDSLHYQYFHDSILYYRWCAEI